MRHEYRGHGSRVVLSLFFFAFFQGYFENARWFAMRYNPTNIKAGWRRNNWGILLFLKIAVVGIVVLSVITAALMPSPGNFLHPQAAGKLTSASKSTETVVQISAQSGPRSDEIMEPSNQTLTQPVTLVTVRPVTETVPEPVYTNVTIVPENVTVTVNQTFSVDMWINNVTDMAGWQMQILWDKNILRCIQAQVNTPPVWGGVSLDLFNKTEADVAKIDPVAVYTAWQFGPGIDNDYNATCGQYFKAQCWGPRGEPNHNTFNGSIAVVTLTFQALQPGTTSLDFSKDDYNVLGRYYEGITIGNRHAEPITLIDYNGFVDVQAPESSGQTDAGLVPESKKLNWNNENVTP